MRLTAHNGVQPSTLIDWRANVLASTKDLHTKHYYFVHSKLYRNHNAELCSW